MSENNRNWRFPAVSTTPYELIRPRDLTAIRDDMIIHHPTQQKPEKALKPLIRPTNFGNNILGCLESTTAYAIDSFKQAVGKQVFFESNANYLRGFTTDYAGLLHKVLDTPENAPYLIPETRNDDFSVNLYTVETARKKIIPKPTKLGLNTHIGTLDPKGNIKNLPNNIGDETPQVRVAFTEITQEGLRSLRSSIAELEAVEQANGGDPGRLLEFKQLARNNLKSLREIYISKFSLSFNVAFFDTELGKPNVMTLGNFNLLVYPDNSIALEFWLNSEQGNRLLTRVEPNEHSLDFAEVERYLDKVYQGLTEGPKASQKKKKSK